jgi:arylsulfatase
VILLVSTISSVAILCGSEWLERNVTYLRHGYSCLDCNVVLISVDTLRADHLGLYGYSRDVGPNLVSHFGAATTFEQAISPSPCTRPAVLQLLTGTYDHDRRRERIAETLKASGYETAAVVAQHWFGTAERPEPEYARGFDYFDVQSANEGDRYGMSRRRASEVVSRAIAWLDGRTSRSKFFLWLHFFDPHDPYWPPEPFRRFGGEAATHRGDVRAALIGARAADADGSIWRRLDARRPGLAKHPWRLYGAALDAEAVADYVGLYDGEVAYVDAQIGRLLDHLDSLGQLDRSIVVVTADHGERLGEDGEWNHCLSLHARETHVPLLMSVRGVRMQDRARVQEVVSTLDVFPTILALLGGTIPPGTFDGVDLTRERRRPSVFSLWPDETVIRNDRFKLYRNTRGDERMYDMHADSEEEHDVLSEHPTTRRSLSGELLEFTESHLDMPSRYQVVVEQLEALGYVD